MNDTQTLPSNSKSDNISFESNRYFLPLNEEFSVSSVEGDADLVGVLDLDVVEVPRDSDVGLLNLFLQTAFQLDVLALIFDLKQNKNI